MTYILAFGVAKAATNYLAGTWSDRYGRKPVRRLDPTCPHHIAAVTDIGARIILVCNEGYSSSLAAAILQRLGLHHATDLRGGFQAWVEDAHPSP